MIAMQSVIVAIAGHFDSFQYLKGSAPRPVLKPSYEGSSRQPSTRRGRRGQSPRHRSDRRSPTGTGATVFGADEEGFPGQTATRPNQMVHRQAVARGANTQSRLCSPVLSRGQGDGSGCAAVFEVPARSRLVVQLPAIDSRPSICSSADSRSSTCDGQVLDPTISTPTAVLQKTAFGLGWR